MDTSYDRLIKFANDTKDINPNLLGDIKSGLIKPCKMLDETMDRYYNKKQSLE